MLRGHAAATCAMSAVVREALFRDIIGFIPVYPAVFTFGLWFGYSQLGWSWLETSGGLAADRALADYGEDLCHLRCLRLHQRGSVSMPLALLGAVMTLVKLAAFVAEGALTLAIVTAATIRIYDAPISTGGAACWRWRSRSRRLRSSPVSVSGPSCIASRRRRGGITTLSRRESHTSCRSTSTRTMPGEGITC